MITKTRVGAFRYSLSGERGEIRDLFLSALNWGAVEEDNEPEEEADGAWTFSVDERKAIRWREEVGRLKFDPEIVETPSLLRYLRAKALAWWQAIPSPHAVLA